MNTVQPIKDINVIKQFIELLGQSTQGKRNVFMFRLGINTALRISDIIKLRVSDVKDKTHLIIKENKTGKTKRQLINTALRNEINLYVAGMNDNDYLFPSRKGDKPVTRVQAYRIMNNVARQLGVEEIGTHSLRKTFGYHFMQKHDDIYMLMDLLNHSAPSVTLRYIGMTQETTDNAIEDFFL